MNVTVPTGNCITGGSPLSATPQRALDVQCTYTVPTVRTMYVHCTYSARWVLAVANQPPLQAQYDVLSCSTGSATVKLQSLGEVFECVGNWTLVTGVTFKYTVRTFNSVHKPAGPPGRFHAQACDRRSAV